MRPEEWHHEGENSPSRRTTGHEEIRACGKGECMGERQTEDGNYCYIHIEYRRYDTELPYITHITAAHRTGKGGCKDRNGRFEEKRGDGGLRGPGNVGEGTRKHGRGNGGIFVMGPGNAGEGMHEGRGTFEGCGNKKKGGTGGRSRAVGIKRRGDGGTFGGTAGTWERGRGDVRGLWE
ncbi:hypothetical protein BD769DRAFT_1388180 [Suillus cothurnatus]|nr:hypothetical protein BD769DRAFT_1388180 [Suillus cothurnatus]